MRMTQKNMADVITLTGVAAILSVVVFATSNDIPVGEMAYQILWLGRMTFVFVVCCLLSFCLNRKNYLSFPTIVTWVLIILGGMEAIWLFPITLYMHLRALSIIRDLIRDIWR